MSATHSYKTATRYSKLAEELRAAIKGGQFQPGEQLPTLAEMKVRYGASQTTMDRAHSILEREGLVYRQERRGVFVSDILGRASSGIIAIYGANPGVTEVPYWTSLFGGIRQAANEHRREILFLGTWSSDIQWEKYDGILTYCSHIQQTIPEGIPCVSAVHIADSMVSVAANDFAGSKAATEHLLGLGHKRIAFLQTSEGSNDAVSRHRVAGYQAAMWEAAIPPDRRWVRPIITESDCIQNFDDLGRARMTQWLNEDWDELDCTAIIAHNDETAIGAIQALQSAGVQVPSQVSVVGFDGSKSSEYFSPQLTTVEIPLCEIGRTAVEVLMRQGRGERVPQTTLLPVQLRVRESTAKVAKGN